MIDKSSNNPNMDMDDARYRIKPYQQIASSCSGAIITSLTSKSIENVCISCFFVMCQDDLASSFKLLLYYQFHNIPTNFCAH